MIDLNLIFKDLSCEWIYSEHLATCGRGHIAAISCPAINMAVDESSHCLKIWIGEIAYPDVIRNAPTDEISILNTCNYSEGEAVLIIIDKSWELPGVSISRTGIGSTPLFVTLVNSCLNITWDFRRAVQSIATPRVNFEAAKRYIEYGPTLTRDQIFNGVDLIVPGESLTWRDNSIVLSSPLKRLVTLTNSFAPGANATQEFVRLIQSRAANILAKSLRPAVELSGGLDSSCVGVSLGGFQSGLLSYGIIQDGVVGEQQLARRNEVIEIARLSDRWVKGSLYPPFSALRLEGNAVTVLDEIYRTQIEAALDNFGDSSPDVVFSGIGGDELTMLKTHGQRAGELATNVASSAMLAAMCRSDMFLRRGIWPKNIFVDQVIVNFCRSLPEKIRNGRLLNILTLARSGISDGFLFPRFRENFRNIFLSDLRSFDVDRFFASSVLHELGIADVSAISRDFHLFINNEGDNDIPVRLYKLIKLEAVLRNYLS